ncbi:TIGR03960 family B12-binding radical SAM protein [Treponema zuelzerae]|uniref:TIGR03960 family B12-binding radical SAM protein n=1 Tax=Teretinema zuelzerae TaxID=156 RepID=A0AAE3JI20_9SPIR|nr:TIGR03960 family B12-binding radical SAM protein [Teretinema zuelzerae]MCD1654597.1 TIGR03960 family B12-binding radical SAM protein [Teretinema zuelzerae]
MNTIDPIRDLSYELASIQNPARYLGGEYGQVKKESADLTFALAFPDLYEIAMSNFAIKLIYDGLNKIPSVRCERVFAPAPDFEKLLEKKRLPLYTLESGIPLKDADIIGVSMGFEPGITGLLSILHSGMVPIEVSKRTADHPIVIAGGCGVTNPAPFSRFIDAFFIGEAEGGMFALVEELAELKRSGAGRSDLLQKIEAHPSVWTPSKDKKRAASQSCARKAFYSEFGALKDSGYTFPLPNLRVVQDHGVIEIMRGCPNGCRFCHAGVYYRPQRIASIRKIISDADFLVDKCGYREISLMSLSSGDYPDIHTLMSTLTTRYKNKKVSFQLPSLKVNSFTLPLLETMSEVRKSGLTFAIETPVDAWQFSLNKEVYREKIIDIILEAKKHGWSKAKFYFMVGLPVEQGGLHEEIEIVNFLLEIQERTRIQCNVNVGTFIPKPHTPYQWSKQLTMAESDQKLDFIRRSLPRGKFKVSTHQSFNSFLEGILSRGDERVGEIIQDAWEQGCRLDAWEDWARPDLWKNAIRNAGWDVESISLRERSFDEPLPWDGVSLGVSKSFLKREKQRSDSAQLTPKCVEECEEPCGVCGTKIKVNTSDVDVSESSAEEQPLAIQAGSQSQEAAYRVVASFTKIREAAYIPHLALLEIWHKAFQCSNLPVVFTEGFNPMPRFEISQSLSLGISSKNEIASFLLYDFSLSEKDIKNLLNSLLPESIQIDDILVYRLSRNVKRSALSSFLWGNRYTYRFINPVSFSKDSSEILESCKNFDPPVDIESEIIEKKSESLVWTVLLPFHADRPFRDLLASMENKPIHEIVQIEKIQTLAKDASGTPISFFEVFSEVAQQNNNAGY